MTIIIVKNDAGPTSNFLKTVLNSVQDNQFLDQNELK